MLFYLNNYGIVKQTAFMDALVHNKLAATAILRFTAQFVPVFQIYHFT